MKPDTFIFDQRGIKASNQPFYWLDYFTSLGILNRGIRRKNGNNQQ